MSNYTGVKCPVCSKNFTQADDIVVCPVCGAPHHRECYAKNSACAFAAEHSSGKEWRSPPPEAPPHGKYADVTLCPSCQSVNPAGNIFCQVCNARLRGVPPPVPPDAQGFPSWAFPRVTANAESGSFVYGGISPDDKIDEEPVRDLAVYIGDNAAYYLPRFKSMEENSYTLSFNFSALIFNFFYFFYRKMYWVGGILLALYIVGMVPNFLLMNEVFPQMLQDVKDTLPQLYWFLDLSALPPVNLMAADHYRYLINMTGFINFFIGLILSFCANHFYYIKAVAAVRKIREQQNMPVDRALYEKELTTKGGCSKAAVIAVLCVIAVGCIAAYLAIFYLNMGGLIP